jgi:hypothetical protein
LVQRGVCAAHSAASIQLAAKPDDKAVGIPEFDVTAIDQRPGAVDRLGIVGAHQRLEGDKRPSSPMI